MTIVRALAVLSLLAFAGPSLAAVAVPLSVEELARGSDAVVRGKVAKTTCRWSSDGRRILTYAEVETGSVWRGSAPVRATVVVPGGEMGDIGQRVDGAPTFTQGEEVVLFLGKAGDSAYRVRGLAQGKFSVGQGTASPALGGTAFVRGKALVAGERRAEAMSVEELERRVRGREVSRLGRALAALLLLALAAPALAFVRSTTAGSPDSGQWLWWRTRNVTYHLNEGSFASVKNCASPSQAAVDAFPAWEQSCTDFTFSGFSSTETALGQDDVNLVVVRQANCSTFAATDPSCKLADLSQCITSNNCWESTDSQHGASGTIALTTVTFTKSTGEILDADMELNGWNQSTTSPTGIYFTCLDSGSACQDRTYGQLNCIAIDVQNTVTHEAGHMLGLDHVCIASFPAPYNACGDLINDTMAPTASYGDTDKRSMAQDDIDGVCTIYPKGQATSKGSPDGSSSQGGGGGCSSAGGGLASLLPLALGPWGRRRRSARG